MVLKCLLCAPALQKLKLSSHFNGMPAAHYGCTTVICLSDMQHLVFLHLVLFLQNTKL